MKNDLTITREIAGVCLNKLESISYLRIFATICVIWLHTCSTLYENPQIFNLDKKQSLFFNAASQTMSWAVPVFFMITGMLFLQSEKHIKAEDWFFKYTRRILMALIVFGVPYAALKMIMSEGLNISLFYKSILMVITDTGFGHLWYLYVLIGIYLMMPVLKSFCEKTSVNEMKLVLIALFVFNFCFPLLSRLTEYEIAFHSQILYPIFYVLMGHCLFENRKKMNKKILYIVILSCVFMIWIFNVFSFKPEVWTSYDSPLIAVLAVSIFAIFIKRKWRNTRLLWEIDRLCFGAYLIHPLFIQFTYRFMKITPIDFCFYPVMTVLFAICFICLAFISTWIMRKIGIIKKYVL